MGSADSKHKHDDDELKKHVLNYNDQLQRALIGCNQARKTFSTLADLWCESRTETVKTMVEVADSMDRHHRNVNIANLGGASSCVAGSTAGIASVILAPVSGGMSVALAAGGIFGTVAGSATVLAANMAEVCLTRELMEKVQRTLNADEIYTKALRAAYKEVIIHENEVATLLNSLTNESKRIDGLCCESLPTSMENLVTMMSRIFNDDENFLQQLERTKCLLARETPTISETVPTSSEFFQALKEFSTIGPVEDTLKRIGEAAVQGSAVTATTAGNVASSVGAQIVALGLGTVFVAIDLHNLVKTSKNFDEGSKTELAKKIRSAVVDLGREYEQVSSLNSFFKKWT